MKKIVADFKCLVENETYRTTFNNEKELKQYIASIEESEFIRSFEIESNN